DLRNVDPATDLEPYVSRTMRGVKEAASTALTRGETRPDALRALVTNNYTRPIMRGYAEQTGVDAQRVYLGNLARFGHAFSADTLINLVDADRAFGLARGDKVLVLGSGPTAWGATLLTKVSG